MAKIYTIVTSIVIFFFIAGNLFSASSVLSTNAHHHNNPLSLSTITTIKNTKEMETIPSPSLLPLNSHTVLIKIIFDSIFINNNRALLGDSVWNFTVNANNKAIDLLSLEKVRDNQTINFHGKNISLLIPNSKNVHISSQPFVIKPSGKWDILDWFGRDYNLTNSFGNGNHTIYPTDGKSTILHFNLLNYKYTVKINKDPDYILKYHIQTTFS